MKCGSCRRRPFQSSKNFAETHLFLEVVELRRAVRSWREKIKQRLHAGGRATNRFVCRVLHFSCLANYQSPSFVSAGAQSRREKIALQSLIDMPEQNEYTQRAVARFSKRIEADEKILRAER